MSEIKFANIEQWEEARQNTEDWVRIAEREVQRAQDNLDAKRERLAQVVAAKPAQDAQNE